ncbi:hypothetical protein VPNG_08818 [Cytospora leucostoma]|uniref:Uncharacterized protein n=1 Tax=Cytospora leucostoma TaxID=1230097 RepID=A0A423W1K0_9PEZI|nr:hypothetical protein VPNG_08818 [Cytospora leucostoma]
MPACFDVAVPVEMDLMQDHRGTAMNRDRRQWSVSSCASHRYCTAFRASGVPPWIGETRREGRRSPQEVLDPVEAAAGASVLWSPIRERCKRQYIAVERLSVAFLASALV